MENSNRTAGLSQENADLYELDPAFGQTMTLSQGTEAPTASDGASQSAATTAPMAPIDGSAALDEQAMYAMLGYGQEEPVRKSRLPLVIGIIVIAIVAIVAAIALLQPSRASSGESRESNPAVASDASSSAATSNTSSSALSASAGSSASAASASQNEQPSQAPVQTENQEANGAAQDSYEYGYSYEEPDYPKPDEGDSGESGVSDSWPGWEEWYARYGWNTGGNQTGIDDNAGTEDETPANDADGNAGGGGDDDTGGGDDDGGEDAGGE